MKITHEGLVDQTRSHYGGSTAPDNPYQVSHLYPGGRDYRSNAGGATYSEETYIRLLGVGLQPETARTRVRTEPPQDRLNR